MAKYFIISTLVFSTLLLFLQNGHCRVIGDRHTKEDISFPLESGNKVWSRNEDEKYSRFSYSEVQSQTKEDANEQYQIKHQCHSNKKEKHSGARSQEEEVTNDQQQLKQQEHSFQTEKYSDLHPRKEEDINDQIKQHDHSLKKDKQLGPLSPEKEVTNDQHQIKQLDHSFLKDKYTDVHSWKEEDISDQIKQRDHSLKKDKHSDAPSQKEEDPSTRSRREENAGENSDIGDDVETIPSVHGKDCSCHGKKLSNIELGFNSTDFFSGPLGFFFGVKAEADQRPYQQWGQAYVPQFGPQQPWNFYQQWWYPGGQSQGANPEQGDAGLNQEPRELEQVES